MSTFNYLKAGFKKIPTDYYFRPIGLALEKFMKNETLFKLIYCLGRKTYAEYIYDYAHELARQYKDKPYFGLFWTNSFTHNDPMGAGAMDWRFRKYLQDFENEKIFENSIVILLSDHGTRFGKLTELSTSYFEERLPMFFISLPNWFKRQYPKFVKALAVNQHRLTSPFDIYVTLQHLLHLDRHREKLPLAENAPLAQSLFYEISKHRSCENAAIPDHYCACDAYKTINSTDETLRKVANLTVKAINDYFVEANITNLCSQLQLVGISTGSQKLKRIKNQLMAVPTYRVSFETLPNRNIFGATVKYNESTNSISVNLDNISRFDMYAKHAWCVNIKKAKKFCYCKTKKN